MVAVGVAVCMLYVDRPLALWFDRRFTGGAAYAVAGAMLRRLDLLLVAGLLLLLAAGVRALAGGSVPSPVRRLTIGMLAAALALIVTVALKLAIGRTPVFPDFLRDGVYAFRPFEGRGYGDFPSATMSVSSALLAGLGPRRRRTCVLAALVLAALAAALLIASGHWLSDIAGGTYLGLCLGTLVRRRAERRARAVSAAPS